MGSGIVQYDIDRLIVERKKQKLTQKDLADKAGVSIATVQGYEQRKYEPKYETVCRVCKALQLRIADVVTPIGTVYDTDYEQSVKQVSPDDADSVWSFLYGESYLDSSHGRALGVLMALVQLNEDGQKEALRQIELLKEIPRFKKDYDDKK